MTFLDQDDPITPLTPPDQALPVHSEENLRQRWRSLLGAGGFAFTSVYLIWFDGDGRQVPCVVPLDHLDDDLHPDLLDALVQLAAMPVAGLADASVALALSRPGSDSITNVDKRQARTITATLRSLSIKVWPIHLATRNSVRQLTADDLLDG